ncbi:Sensor protein QseC [Halioglobus japonicus]|nr:Sensor protein QseC [Halioglobus japonicus]
MRFALSLRWFVWLTFLLLTLTLVAGYSMLSADYFIRGMDNITALQMERAAQSYLAATPQDKRLQPETVLDYTVFPKWQQVPEKLRGQFEAAQKKPDQLLKLVNRNEDGRKHSVDFLFHYSRGEGNVYVTYRVSPDTISAMVRSNSRANREKLLMISIAAAMALSLIIWLLLRRISQPVSRLVEWTSTLDPGSLKTAPPDFTYPELNNLAQLIRSSLSSVQESLDREHRFLRHTSHELRTPISTFRNNVELLRKLQAHKHPIDEQEKQVIERLDRSSLTMKHLTETLLWLSRDSAQAPPTQDVALHELIAQLTNEVEYLLKDKPVEVVLDTEPCQRVLPETVVRIVAGNLIRNAFQHTWEGTVTIRQQGATVEITNPYEPTPGNTDLGFGLGLNLTEQLCQKLNWKYTNTAQGSERCAAVTFSS